MLKKILVASAVVIALLVVSGYLFRDQIFMALAASQLSPENDFSADQAPPAPDYGDAAAWAALPSKEDPADEHPDGLERTPTDVAVFFVARTFVSEPRLLSTGKPVMTRLKWRLSLK